MDPQAFCDWSRSLSWAFEPCPIHARPGEASVRYLPSPTAPLEISRAIPAVRLIAVLRHPVDLAFSHWRFLRPISREPIADFEHALFAAEHRLSLGWRQTWDYIGLGQYAKQLERWFACFARKQILIIFYEDWLACPQLVLSQVFRHIDVAPGMSIEVERKNVTVSARWPRLQRWLDSGASGQGLLRPMIPSPLRRLAAQQLRQLNTRGPMELDAGLRARLVGLFDADITRLESMTQRDLGSWRR